jgi:hypothetical protein
MYFSVHCCFANPDISPTDDIFGLARLSLISLATVAVIPNWAGADLRDHRLAARLRNVLGIPRARLFIRPAPSTAHRQELHGCMQDITAEVRQTFRPGHPLTLESSRCLVLEIPSNLQPQVLFVVSCDHASSRLVRKCFPPAATGRKPWLRPAGESGLVL